MVGYILATQKLPTETDFLRLKPNSRLNEYFKIKAVGRDSTTIIDAVERFYMWETSKGGNRARGVINKKGIGRVRNGMLTEV